MFVIQLWEPDQKMFPIEKFIYSNIFFNYIRLQCQLYELGMLNYNKNLHV